MSLTEIQEIPFSNMVLLVGSPGAGKSTFCQETVLKNITLGPVVYVTTESTPSQIIESLRQKGLGEQLPHTLVFVDAFRETVGLPSIERSDVVDASCGDLTGLSIAITKMRERIDENALLVFDSLTSPYLMNGSEILSFIRTTLLRLALEGNAVLTCIDEGCGKPEDLVAMMSLSNGVIKMKIEKDKEFLNVVKHPKVRPTRIEVPIEPERLGFVKKRIYDMGMVKKVYQAAMRGDEAIWRREAGDFVNLFWPNLVPWSGMLWDPKRFPIIFYEVNKDEGPAVGPELISKVFPWHMRLLLKLFMPKSLSKVSDIKKVLKGDISAHKQERSGIIEYLEDISKTDEYYFRVYECFNCWGFENIGTPMASFLPAMLAGSCKGFELYKGLERDWNAVETKCIGLGDPYCEIKLVPGKIDELEGSLEKDVSVIERIHDRLMDRLMGFLLHGKPLVERPQLGSDIHVHPTFHTMGSENITAMSRIWSERYQMALRMGGAKAGKEVGEHLLEAEIKEEDAVTRILHFLEHCKVGKVTVDETIKIKENCENAITKVMKVKLKEPSCYFTTGFLNGFFLVVKNQHVKETKCIAMGDPYCEWEFR